LDKALETKSFCQLFEFRKEWGGRRINAIIRGFVAGVEPKKDGWRRGLNKKNRWKFPPVLNFM
jgi:hypothetical protein